MEEKKRLEVNKVNYKRLYFDFISELSDLSVYEKLMLTRHINTYFNASFSFKQLYKINHLIQKSLKRMNYKTKRKSVNAYDKRYILEILSYQKELGLSDSTMSLEFKLSRNTLASWKKRFDNF
jgi:hypothetical protein